MRKPRPLAERLWEKVDRSGGPDACWPFRTAVERETYGTIRGEGGALSSSIGSHRAACAVANGIKTADLGGIVVRHSCDYPPCCNPAHLLPGSQQDNVADREGRGRTWRPTHCKQGHELTPDNIRVRGRGSRTCRTCETARAKRYYEQSKGSSL